MADQTGTTPKQTSTSRVVTRTAANRAAAAKVYVAAMKKAGKEVPASVKKLAGMAGQVGTSFGKVPHSGVMSKKLANKIAAAKVYEAAMKKVGEEAPESVRRLARRAS